MSVNKVFILGNLGKAPNLRYTGTGKAVCEFSVATTERWTDKNSGEKKEVTDWHTIQIWGKLGEICGERLRKGNKVYVDGSLRSQSWDDNKTGQKRYRTIVAANKIEFLDKRENGQEDTAKQPPIDDDDSIPF